MSLKDISRMLDDPSVPFDLSMIERSLLSMINETHTDPQPVIAAFREIFTTVRSSGESARQEVAAVMRVMVSGHDTLPERMNPEEFHEKTVVLCADFARDQVMRQITRAALLKVMEEIEGNNRDSV